jgi:hypothetical protein
MNPGSVASISYLSGNRSAIGDGVIRARHRGCIRDIASEIRDVCRSIVLFCAVENIHGVVRRRLLMWVSTWMKSAMLGGVGRWS